MKALEQNYNDDPTINWKRYLGAMMRFKDPFFPGFENFKEFDSEDEESEDFYYEKIQESENQIIDPDLYVSVALMKPGK